MQSFLADRDRLSLVLNRFGRSQDFLNRMSNPHANKTALESPQSIRIDAQGIDRGTPVTEQNHSEIARSFVGLASA